MPQVTARGAAAEVVTAAAERPAGPPANGRRPRGPFGGGAPPPRAAAARRRAAAQRPPGFFELGAFSWCGSCRAPRELENPSSLSFQLVRVAENGPRARFPSFPDHH